MALLGHIGTYVLHWGTEDPSGGIVWVPNPAQTCEVRLRGNGARRENHPRAWTLEFFKALYRLDYWSQVDSVGHDQA